MRALSSRLSPRMGAALLGSTECRPRSGASVTHAKSTSRGLRPVARGVSPLSGLRRFLYGTRYQGLKTLGYFLTPLGGAQIRNRCRNSLAADPRRHSRIPRTDLGRSEFLWLNGDREFCSSKVQSARERQSTRRLLLPDRRLVNETSSQGGVVWSPIFNLSAWKEPGVVSAEI
jgi:hypothetical protein